jgi:hypothetical protein
MKRRGTGKGLMVVGSMRKDGITTYLKQGQLIIRSANSMERRSNTLPQFIQRQKMRHSVALWRMLKYCEPMFTQGTTAYNNFLSLANRLPVVYVEKVLMENTSFLMPGIPVSDGTLPEIKEELGEIDGMPALITDLKPHDWEPWTKLWLYSAVQTGSERSILVRFSKREVPWEEVRLVDGHYVLKGDEFANDMKGWALVLVKGERCSPQTIVTRCTLYQQYTTKEALEKAADSYGGLTSQGLL